MSLRKQEYIEEIKLKLSKILIVLSIVLPFLATLMATLENVEGYGKINYIIPGYSEGSSLLNKLMYQSDCITREKDREFEKLERIFYSHGNARKFDYSITEICPEGETAIVTLSNKTIPVEIISVRKFHQILAIENKNTIIEWVSESQHNLVSKCLVILIVSGVLSGALGNYLLRKKRISSACEYFGSI